MKVGVIGAMEAEVQIIRDKILDKKSVCLAGHQFDVGVLNGVEIFLLQSGIGKVSAAFSSALLLYIYKPDLIINTGSAGGVVSTLKIGDIVISDEVRYYDANITEYGYQLGQIPGHPVGFKANNHLIKIAELCAKKLNFCSMSGLVISGDTFINSTTQLKNIVDNFPTVISLDMESAAIGHVCHQFSTPFIVVRSVSDSSNSSARFNFDNFIQTAAQRSSSVVENMLTCLSELDVLCND
ncbi:5'-methylthioadenosine/S-adenosylhomocysteine nucleosidase [Candidatus Erwinia haradaeae]|uniref:5'-methylthioadenosine/S-adenosylhomocysteine nucleosidase n=1 Tax=Candidatus Erwinia haradaeae TaxID=1922217 RepID=A0A451D9X6_9GAMM|nr:5'-methylthioadenosine/S-adenosylhomocysteine nucleosidase [Candidatus Erwinia haradaeae]VFP83096.1 5'-methylthioadenosine/S-adenosylhomocysteine nucleosidase [Candidatus Erwinia haradaeae]